MPGPADRVLVADIGGTFARFALAQAGTLVTDVHTFPSTGVASLSDLCVAACQEFDAPISGAAIAIAGPAGKGRGRLTQVGCDIQEVELAAALGVERLLLLNDFAALAMSLPALVGEDLCSIPPTGASAHSVKTASSVHSVKTIHSVNSVNSVKTARSIERQENISTLPRVVFGPGTGLGVAALLQLDGKFVALNSEGGHSSFSPANAFESKLLEYAQQRYGRVSWERVLSGPGLELIDAVSTLQFGLGGKPRTAKEIIEAAQAGDCPVARHSVRCFAELLGSFGGDLALMFGAGGGVFVGGGIAQRLAGLIALEDSRERFCRKGRFSGWLENLPFAIVRHPHAALVGAARAYAEQHPG